MRPGARPAGSPARTPSPAALAAMSGAVDLAAVKARNEAAARAATAPPPENGQFVIDVDEARSEEHTSELQSQSNLVCRLLLEKKKKKINSDNPKKKKKKKKKRN